MQRERHAIDEEARAQLDGLLRQVSVEVRSTFAIVHNADVLTLKGSSYRLKDTGIDTLPSARADNTAQ